MGDAVGEVLVNDPARRTKRCARCGETKALSEFNLLPGRVVPRRDTACQTCRPVPKPYRRMNVSGAIQASEQRSRIEAIPIELPKGKPPRITRVDPALLRDVSSPADVYRVLHGVA